MGRKDLWQIDYFDDKERFADIFNGTIFQGRQVMKAEELEEADPELVHHLENRKSVSVIRDKVCKWKGQHFSIHILENQSYVDYRMVLRVMLEESLSYIRQQKRAYRKWYKKGYKFTKDEFLSQMRRDEKLIPVITLVLYLGKECIWDGAKCLYELLKIDEELKPFVTNYKLNIFDYHDYEEFMQFKTENRFMFELLSCAKDRSKTEKVIKSYLDDRLVDKETVTAISGMLDIKFDFDKIQKINGERKGYSVCKAWDDQKELGRQEGRQEGLISLVSILSSILPNFDTVYEKIASDENYKDVTREQVEEYYFNCTKKEGYVTI